MTREAAIARAVGSYDDGSFVADLARRVAIRTESQVPASHPFLRTYLADEVGPCMERIGYATRILDNPVAEGKDVHQLSCSLRPVVLFIWKAWQARAPPTSLRRTATVCRRFAAAETLFTTGFHANPA